ncbi:hypothetical protein EJ08DRAFT_704045 [Tothia fuscella]|uniref:Uncharacterized protein n=1 Tax=Tothia fuscella TaxID=1048955 RepID=A0A9P4TS93_9PEZI|nr:hypothetical protein EJ08DRAFT_704045 [Tothia fuscella]
MNLPRPPSWWINYSKDYNSLILNLPDLQLAEEAWNLIFSNGSGDELNDNKGEFNDFINKDNKEDKEDEEDKEDKEDK